MVCILEYDEKGKIFGVECTIAEYGTVGFRRDRKATKKVEKINFPFKPAGTNEERDKIVKFGKDLADLIGNYYNIGYDGI